ncbi:hypothetical protein BGZ98_002248 [Dissophora globulifera]|nr:hypothetical protein BGZ98_002248 [Dissophora globulifera]
MSYPDNYISFHDLGPEARFLWLSPSVYDVLGYTPEELVGLPTYDILSPDAIAQSRVIHKENLLNDLVASQIPVRYKTKNGGTISCISVFSLCYDFIVNCSTVVDSSVPYKQLRAHSAAMTRLVGTRKEEFERIKRHHEAFAANTWDMRGMEPELRVCMILNRFSRNLIIMYASSACERIFHINPEHIVGKPILLFIRADDLAAFVEQMDTVKTSAAITHMRFWFQSPRLPQEIPCEAVIFASADGIVAVMRRCRPFVRKRFIGSRDNYQAATAAAAAAAANNNKNRSQSSSWTSASSASPSFASSAASVVSMSPSPPHQDRQHVVAEDDLNNATSPPRNAPMSRISRIQILDLDRNSNSDTSNGNNINNTSKSSGTRNTRGKTRPLAIPRDDPLLVKDGQDLPEGFGIKVYDVQDYVEEQSDDDDSSDDIDDYGADGGSESNTRQECDMDIDLDIS